MENDPTQRKAQSQLYRESFEAVHEVLIHEWDPIRVGDEPMAQDEYDMYIPDLLRLLVGKRDDAAVARHLEYIETTQMGLAPDPARNLGVARRLWEVTEPARRNNR